MRILSILSCMFLLQASSCNKEDPVIKNNGVITSKPATWLTPISENNQDAIAVRNNIKYKNTVVIGSIENGKNGITGIDVTNGGKLWTWQDNFDNYTLDIADSYNDKYLVWDEGRNLYCVNLTNGTTVWKKRYGNNDSPYLLNVSGLETEFYVSSYWPYEGNPKEAHIYKTSVARGSDLQEVFRITEDNQNLPHGIAEMAVFTNDEGNTLLFADSYSYDPDFSGNMVQGYFNLYNVSENKWVYYKKESNISSTGITKPKQYNGIVYIAMSPYIVAIELMSGEIVWKQKFGDKVNFYNSGFILIPEKSLIIFNAETSSTTLFALNLTTGNEVWSEPSSGTSSHLQYLNGVVYFVGGGDGLLHAVDIDTGKHLWKIRSPDEAINSNAWFARYCAVFPGADGEKGKVVVSSGLNAFAYEAER